MALQLTITVLKSFKTQPIIMLPMITFLLHLYWLGHELGIPNLHTRRVDRNPDVPTTNRGSLYLGF